MSRVLVTGASGFIGSHVVRAALERGDDVVAQVRSRRRAGALPDVGARLHVVEADLADSEAMRSLIAEAKPDLGLHLAWPLGPDYESPEHLTCVGGSLALLRELVEAACPRIVFVGTHHELAPSDADLDESAAVEPRNLYAVCKDAVHRIGRAYTERSSSAFVWARLFNVYGPGQSEWALVPHIIGNLLADRPCHLTSGDQVRVFLHVRDAAASLLAVGDSTVRGVVHIGADEGVSVRSLALAIGDRLARRALLSFGEVSPRADDPPRVVSANRRLHSEVGFHPRVRLEDGLSETIEWFRNRSVSASLELQ